MKPKNKILNWGIIWILIVSLFLPIGNVFAAGQLVYFQFSNISTVQSDPTISSKQTMDISATYNSVSPDSITYQVTQVTTGKVSKGTGQVPVLDRMHNTVTFTSVPLFPGLNEVDFIGTNAAGAQVENVGWVQYSGNPGIYNIQTATGQALGGTQPVIVTSNPLPVTFSAPNADSVDVTINGQNSPSAVGLGNSNFAATINLTKGDNQVTLMAKSATGTLSQTFDVVYYDGTPTAYQVTFGGSNNVLIGNPTFTNITIDSNNNVAVNGWVAFPHTNTPPDFSKATMYLDSNSQFPMTFDANSKVTTGGNDIYPFSGTITQSSFSSGTSYTLTLLIPDPNQGNQLIQNQLKFTYQSGSAPYISSLSELKGVSGQIAGDTQATASNYQSSQTISGTAQSPYPVNQLPIYLGVTIQNLTSQVDLSKITLNTPSGQLNQYQAYLMSYGPSPSNPGTNDELVGIAVNNLPTGSFPLTASYVDATANANSTYTFYISSTNTPSIELLNVADGQIFTTGSMPAIQFKTVNFQGASTQVDVNVNGTHSTVSTSGSQSIYSYPTPSSTTIPLMSGPNRIILSATIGNINISTAVTVYYFSDLLPQLTINPPQSGTSNIIPPPVLDQSGTGQYSTADTKAIVSGSMQYIDKLVISVNGSALTTIYNTRYDSSVQTGYVKYSDVNGDWYYDPNLISGFTYDSTLKYEKFTLSPYLLQQKGATTFSFQGFNTSGNQIYKSVEIDRVVPPYTIVYPDLTNGGIINQNYLPVVVHAEGADSVVINKITAKPTGNTDEYGVELEGLKAGTNTISIVVTRGTSKTTGSFTVNNVDQPKVGAQYKNQLSTSGKFSAFNNQLTLTFPKNTVLRPASNNPAKDTGVFDNSRYILAGIADPASGSINQAGVDVSDSYAKAVLGAIPTGFLNNGNLFWVDAGQANQVPLNSFMPNGGLPPLARNNPPSWFQIPSASQFYNRASYVNWMQPTNNGSLTLQYDPSISNGVQTQLSIWHYGYLDEGYVGWENLGGVVNTSKHTITIPFTKFGYYTVMLEVSAFVDIDHHPWGKIALNTMYAKGVMQPKSIGQFGTDDNISRAEFTQMLVKALNVPLSYDSSHPTFYDVPFINVVGNLWNYKYVETAARKGIVQGVAPGYFAPNDNLTREQAAVMIANAANYKLSLDPSTAKSAISKLYTDSGSADYYAVPAILAVSKAKIMNGKPTDPNAKKPTYYFDPQAPLSRAEAASIAMRLMQSLKLLPTTT